MAGARRVTSRTSELGPVRPDRSLSLVPPALESTYLKPVSPLDVLRRDVLGHLVREYQGAAT